MDQLLRYIAIVLAFFTLVSLFINNKVIFGADRQHLITYYALILLLHDFKAAIVICSFRLSTTIQRIT